jgi:putative hemolysin
MADGGHAAASLYHKLSDSHLAPLEYHVFPRCPLPMERLRTDLPAEAPPLIKGYLRSGAWICGEPAWDPDFESADLFVMMPLANLDSRYARHYGVAA